jgi:hypothetical protein
MVPSHRPVGFADGDPALTARQSRRVFDRAGALPPVYGWDFFTIGLSSPRLGEAENKVMAGETPANPATPVGHKRELIPSVL